MLDQQKFDPKKFWVKKNLGKIIFGPRNFWKKENCWAHKNFVSKELLGQKIFGPNGLTRGGSRVIVGGAVGGVGGGGGQVFQSLCQI